MTKVTTYENKYMLRASTLKTAKYELKVFLPIPIHPQELVLLSPRFSIPVLIAI